MDNSPAINRTIKKRDGKSLSILFDITRKKNQMILTHNTISNLTSPFDKIIPLNYSLNYDDGIQILQLMRMEDEWAIPIYKRILFNLYNSSKLCGKESDFAKRLMGLFRYTKGTFYYFVINMLLFIYYKTNNYTLIDNLVSVVQEPKMKSKQSAIYFYFLGLTKLARDDFEMGYKYLRESFKYKFIREEAALPLFIAATLNMKKIRIEAISKYRLEEFTFLLDIWKGNELNIGNCEILMNLNLLRVSRIYFPLISLRNSILQVYKAVDSNSRIEIKFLTWRLKAKSEVVISNLIQLISIGLIKGYLSINKQCLVVSKTDPFPKIIK